MILNVKFYVERFEIQYRFQGYIFLTSPNWVPVSNLCGIFDIDFSKVDLLVGVVKASARDARFFNDSDGPCHVADGLVEVTLSLKNPK